MSLDINVPGGDPNMPGFSVQRNKHGLSISAGALASTNTMFGMANDEGGLSISAFPVAEISAGGWAVYTFHQSGAFTLTRRAAVLADILLVGGGGSGGGGVYGGGGGAGGFVDKHKVLIYSHDSAPPHGGPSYPDGEVIVGDGGASIPVTSVAGSRNQGGDSLLGPSLIAHGGGYGGRNGGVASASYPPSNGASGGGGRGTETWVSKDAGGVNFYEGIPGQAIYNRPVPGGGNAKDYEEGHDGGSGSNSSAWYAHSAGGGGGASWPAYDSPYTGGVHMTGGLGRVCDIGGRYQCPDPFNAGMYRELGTPYVQWFAGGGAGKEKPNNWGYPSGGAGYRGGGATGQEGIPNTGGGGGGGSGTGSGGGSGIVIIRIPLSQKRYVTSPLQLTDEGGMPLSTPVWDAWNEAWIQEPVYPAGITYHEVPADEPHIDQRGDAEPALIWGYPETHYHYWGWDPGDFSESG